MADILPRIIENREFVGYEEEDIQKLNRSEAEKFARNPDIKSLMEQVQAELGEDGEWEEHWLALDASGSRVYARIYYTADRGLAITADGRIIEDLHYPQAAEEAEAERELH